ncbi:MAG TPA: monovalent cation/H(+) antiporter subunit G [Aggregatilineales bacterium]|nr:monovalent cation/H(+) antiporter subunit G [Aggregatilineales bacterium]
MNLNEILGIIAMCIGCFFYFAGVVGLTRFPDIYLRIQAASMTSTLGIAGLLIGAAFLSPDSALLIIAWAAFMIMSSPVASHAIASAAYRSGVKMANPMRDDLEGVIIPAERVTHDAVLDPDVNH